MKKITILATLVVLIFGFSLPAIAAIDPIPGVDIIVKKNPGQLVVANVTTDKSGAFKVNNLGPGEYELIVKPPTTEAPSIFTITFSGALASPDQPTVDNSSVADSTTTYTFTSNSQGALRFEVVGTSLRSTEIARNLVSYSTKDGLMIVRYLFGLRGGTVSGTVSVGQCIRIDCEIMTVANLGVSNVGILPTSGWYFLKEWKRGIIRVLTFNAVAKAELELKITNEKAAEILGVEKSDPKDIIGLQKAVKNYTKSEERLGTVLKSGNIPTDSRDATKLLQAIDAQSTIHLSLFSQLAFKIADNESPTPEGIHVVAGDVNGDGVPDERVEGLTELVGDIVNAETNIEKSIAIVIDKNANAKQKAADEIAIAQVNIQIFLNTNVTGRVTSVVADPTDSSNTYFVGTANGGVWKSATITKAQTHLDQAKIAFADGKYGEAFGLARSAEVNANEALRVTAVYGWNQSNPKTSREPSPNKKPTSRGIIENTKSTTSQTKTSAPDTTKPETIVQPTGDIMVEPDETKVHPIPDATPTATPSTNGSGSGAGGGAMGP